MRDQPHVKSEGGVIDGLHVLAVDFSRFVKAERRGLLLNGLEQCQNLSFFHNSY